MINRLLYFFLFLFSVLQVSAQSGSVSPYSRFGIGDLAFSGFTNQLMMGNVGVAQNDSFNINILNPAGYAAIKMSLFDAGMRTDVTNIQNKNQSTSKSNASINNFALGFPIKKYHAGIALGLMPYSTTGYNIKHASLNNVGQSYFTNYVGTGGLSRFFLGTGVKINRHISAGLDASYIFGSTKRERSIEYLDKSYYSIRNVQNNYTGDFNFKYGLLFRFDSIVGVKNKKTIARFDSLAYDSLTARQKMKFGLSRPVKLTFGFSSNFSNNLKGSYDLLTETYKVNSFGNVLTRDTIQNEQDLPTSNTIATTYLSGVALEVTYHWRIEVDFGFSDWSNFTVTEADESLRNGYFIALGGELLPNYKSPKYLNRIVYRMGGRYAATRLELKNQPINDYSVSFGFGVPVSSANNKAFGAQFTRVNLGFEFGNRGTTNENLLKESYFRFHFGVVFTETWFMKRKYD